MLHSTSCLRIDCSSISKRLVDISCTAGMNDNVVLSPATKKNASCMVGFSMQFVFLSVRPLFTMCVCVFFYFLSVYSLSVISRLSLMLNVACSIETTYL